MPATQTIGLLITEMRVNSAEFRAEVDKARDSMGKLGEHAAVTTRSMARFGAIGLEALIPGLQGSRLAIEGVIQALVRARGALALISTGTSVLAAGFAGFALGNIIRNFQDLQKEGHGYVESLKLAVGMTKSYEQATKDAAEEQKKFSAAQAAARNVMQDLQKELATLTDDTETLLKLQETGRRERVQQLPSAERAAGQAIADRAAIEAQRQARAKRQEDLLKSILDEREAQVKAWQSETDALVAQLQTRLDLRKKFEELQKAAGLTGGLAGGLSAVEAAQEQTRAEARALAIREAQGLSQTDVVAEQEAIRQRALARLGGLREQFGDLPAVLDAVAKAEDRLNFGQLGNEMAKARTEVQQFVVTNQSLEQGLGAVAAQLVKTLPDTESAGKAIEALSLKYQALMFAVFGATQQVAQFNSVTSGSGETSAALPNTGIQVVE